MVIKLQQIEKLLKELGKAKKMKNRLGMTNASNANRRRGSRVGSRGVLDSTLRGLKRPDSTSKFGIIREDVEGNDSDEELLSKNSTLKQ